MYTKSTCRLLAYFTLYIYILKVAGLHFNKILTNKPLSSSNRIFDTEESSATADTQLNDHLNY